MNRQQRRHQARVSQVSLNELIMPPQMTTAECAMIARDRIVNNCLATKHPYHHLTANNVIVDADPTLEYLMKRLETEDPANFAILKRHADTALAHVPTNAPKAIPVNRKFYGHDPFEKH